VSGTILELDSRATTRFLTVRETNTWHVPPVARRYFDLRTCGKRRPSHPREESCDRRALVLTESNDQVGATPELSARAIDQISDNDERDMQNARLPER